MQEGSVLTFSPSFSSYSSVRFAEIAAKISEEFRNEREQLGLQASVNANGETKNPTSSNEKQQQQQQQQQRKEEEEGGSNDDTDNDGFEFSCVCRDHEALTISADQIFSNGQIRPIFPIYNRDLLFSEESKPANALSLRLPLRKFLTEERDRRSQSLSEADELKEIPTGTYCVWTPKSDQSSPERCKKSDSTGTSKRWRLRDFINRSNSDGKETLVVLARSATCSKSKKREGKIEMSEVSKEMRIFGDASVPGKVKRKGISGEAIVSAHEIHYVKNRALSEIDRRRCYLPYRKDIIGFFANMNGLSKKLHPF